MASSLTPPPTNAHFWQKMREQAAHQWTNPHGHLVWTLHLSDYQRYSFDFQHCTCQHGWRQFDTHQDAWYFGIWIHDTRRHIVTYAEGDLTVMECLDHESFLEELKHLHSVYGDAPPIALVLDEAGDLLQVYDEQARRLPEHEVS